MVEFASTKPLRIEKGLYLLEGTLKGNEKTVVGVDPGVNFGLTIINREYVQVYWGKLQSEKETGKKGISAYDYVMKMAKLGSYDKSWKAVVEGAAYHSQFGQVGLEEVRFGFYIALAHSGFDVVVTPPATIRKGAFGDGRQQAGDLYPTLNHNGADSIGCALYALTL